MLCQLPTYRAEATTSGAFVAFWSSRYLDPREELYDKSIGRPLTRERVQNLFVWKNGGRLAALKARSVEKNFIARMSEALDLPASVDAAQFLDLFDEGGAIWRIFWLHCWQPDRFPIWRIIYFQSFPSVLHGRCVVALIALNFWLYLRTG